MPANTLKGKLAELQTSVQNGFNPTGDASVANVLSGKTFYSNDIATKRTGTMPNNAGTNASLKSPVVSGTTTVGIIPIVGYYDGDNDTITITDAALVTGNIKAGATILGVSGKTSVVDTADANAVASDIALGKTCYVNGVKITGTHE